MPIMALPSAFKGANYCSLHPLVTVVAREPSFARLPMIVAKEGQPWS